MPERRNVYVYVSSYSPSETFPDCRPPHVDTGVCVAHDGSIVPVEGHDVLKIDDGRTDPAERVRPDELNVQTQPDHLDR